MSVDLTKALADLEEQKVLEEVKRQLDAGVAPTEILAACQAGYGRCRGAISKSGLLCL